MVIPVRSLRKMVFYSAILVLLAGVWVGIYASSQGLTQSWRESIRREFARQGIILSMGKVTIDPFHGMVARDVRLYDDPEQRRVLAEISQIDLDMSIPRLFRKEVVINRVHVRNARASLPLDPDTPDGERLEVEDFSLRVLLDEDQIEVQEMRGRLFGILCSVSGVLTHSRDRAAGGPAGLRPGLADLEPEQALRASEMLGILRRLHWERGRPAELQVRAAGDLGALEDGSYEFSFKAPELAWDDIRAEEVVARGRYENGILFAEDLRFRDAGGSFRGEADFVRATRRLRFNLESDAALAERLRRHWWPEAWPALRLDAPPLLALGGIIRIPETGEPRIPEGEMTGTLALGRFALGGADFDYASASLAMAGPRLFLRDLKLRQGAGTLEGSLLAEDGGLRTRGVSTLAPALGLPFCPAGSPVGKVLAAIETDAGSLHRFEFELAGRFGEPRSWELDSSFEVAALRFNGLPVTRANARLQVGGGVTTFAGCRIEWPAGLPVMAGEGRTTAPTVAGAETITIQGPRGAVRTGFKAAVCRGWPHLAVAGVVPGAAPHLPVFHLADPCRTEVEGTFEQNLGEATRLAVSLRGGGGARWPFLGRLVPLDQPEVEVSLRGREARITRAEAGLFGGRAGGIFRIGNLGRPVRSCSGDLALAGVSYQGLLRLFGDPAAEARGEIDLSFSFDTERSDIGSLNGTGRAALRHGDLFAVPLFGPLSPLVEAALPELGLGYSVASEAGTGFLVQQGILRTDDFTALTPAFKMDGRGTINLATREVDFFSRLNARGLAKVATVVFSYIFEYKCEGPLDDPRWRPLHIPQLPRPGARQAVQPAAAKP
jgi:hypothetical protein